MMTAVERYLQFLDDLITKKQKIGKNEVVDDVLAREDSLDDMVEENDDLHTFIEDELTYVFISNNAYRYYVIGVRELRDDLLMILEEQEKIKNGGSSARLDARLKKQQDFIDNIGK